MLPTCAYRRDGVAAIKLIDTDDFVGVKFEGDNTSETAYVEQLNYTGEIVDIAAPDGAAKYASSLTGDVYTHTLTTVIPSLDAEMQALLHLGTKRRYIVIWQDNSRGWHLCGYKAGARLTYANQTDGGIGAVVTLTAKSQYPLFAIDPEAFTPPPPKWVINGFASLRTYDGASLNQHMVMCKDVLERGVWPGLIRGVPGNVTNTALEAVLRYDTETLTYVEESRAVGQSDYTYPRAYVKSGEKGWLTHGYMSGSSYVSAQLTEPLTQPISNNSQPVGAEVNGMVYVNGAWLYCDANGGSGGGVYKATEIARNSWSKVMSNDDTRRLVTMREANGVIFMMVVKIGAGNPPPEVWISTDGGATWPNVLTSSDWEYQNVFLRSVDYLSDGYYYVVTSSGHRYNVWRSADLSNWERVYNVVRNSSTLLNAGIIYDGHTYYLLGFMIVNTPDWVTYNADMPCPGQTYQQHPAGHAYDGKEYLIWALNGAVTVTQSIVDTTQ
jgi:hypothetical protein